MHLEFENSQNTSYEHKRKTLLRGKENHSLNRNSVIYSSIIEKSGQFQSIKIEQGHYFGQLQNSKPHGVGSCFFNEGGLYYGEWRNNQMQGLGILFFGIGGYVRGDFLKNKVDGFAELCYQNGSTYQGQFTEGKQNGNGIKNSRRGKEFVSYREGIRVYGETQINSIDMLTMLKQNLPQMYIHNDRVVYGLCCDLSGLGAIYHSNGRIDMGWFQNGSLNGLGRIIFKSGDIYDGSLKNGQFNGQGVYMNYSTKQMTEGLFEKNQMVDIQRQLKSPLSGHGGVVDERIVIKNTHLKTRTQFYQDKTQQSNNKVNKIQNLISHMLNPRKTATNQTYGNNSTQQSIGNEEILDKLLSRVQSPQQRRNLESIISQVTSPSRVR